MTADRDAADGRERDPLLAVVADPERGRERLPDLLDSLGDDDRRRRLRAALAVCLAVEASPDLLEPVAGELLDRLDGDSPVEVPHALGYLAARDPEAVEAVASDPPDEAKRWMSRYRRRSDARGTPADERSERAADGDATSAGRADADSANDGTTAAVADSDDRSGPRTSANDWNDGETGSADGHHSDGERAVTRADLSLVEDRLSGVIDRSRFEEVRVRSTGRRGRFGRRYRAVGTADGDELPLSLVVFRVPEGGSEAFARELGEALDGWTGVGDRETVLTVHDWGLRPRPWAAIEHTNVTLADRDALGPAEAVANAVDTADALGHAHRHGAVHGALDPATVAYPDTVIRETERRRPRVTAFGLARVYADVRGLSAFIDPRYAAPEHYDDRFGRVDNATDVYAVGALLYRLATGEAPFLGRPEEIRTGVLSERTPVPSEVDPDLPADLDRVVRKAMATRKLTRYETVTHVRRELEGIDADGG